MRIGIGALNHETNSFSNIPVTWELMEQCSVEGVQFCEQFACVRDYIGGFLAEANALDVEIVPSVTAFLCPSGHICKEALEKHWDKIVQMLWLAHQKEPLDAIALHLHGAGVADDYPDAVGEILRAVRQRFGPDMPIGVLLDLHANVTDEMMEYADLLMGIKCYPHVDQFESGRAMFNRLVDMVKRQYRPCMRLVRLPWLLVPAEGVTTSGPAYDIQQLCLAKMQEIEELFDLTFFHGFPYSDIGPAGVTVTAVAKTKEAADKNALEIAQYAWNHRRDFSVPAYSPAQAFDLILQNPLNQGPLVINESSDNTGGGAPGDGTHLLAEMLKRNIPNSAMGYIYDPEVVQLAAEAGVGARISCRLGGKTDNLHGDPIDLTDAYVKCICDGRAVNHSPMGGGGITYTGLSVCLVVKNVSIIVGSVRTQPMDDSVFRMVGLRYDLLQIVGIKSSQHFKGWWADRAVAIVPCDPPGVHCADLRQFNFRYTNTAYYPLGDAQWETPEV